MQCSVSRWKYRHLVAPCGIETHESSNTTPLKTPTQHIVTRPTAHNGQHDSGPRETSARLLSATWDTIASVTAERSDQRPTGPEDWLEASSYAMHSPPVPQLKLVAGNLALSSSDARTGDFFPL
jgi:hypothetical protein